MIIAHSAPSLADVQAFQALEPELQAQLVRLFGFNPLEDDGAEDADAELEDAYRAGFEAAWDEIGMPSYRTGLFNRWLRNHHARRRARAAGGE